MNKKAKLAIFGTILSLIIAAIIILPFMSTAQAEISYNNNLAFTPSEIKDKVPLTAEKDSDWQVEWHETYAGLTHREYVVAIQNQKETSSEFALSVIFDSLNFDASQVRNINIQESKLVSRDIPVYESIQNCEYPSVIDNETEQVIGNSTLCSSSQQLKGYDTIQFYDWVKAKDTSSEIETSDVKQEAYDSISFEGKSGKEESNIRYFKLGFDVPIVQTGEGWGSEGRVAFVEKNSGKEYHPMWKQSYAYYRNMTINSTITSEIKNLTIPINGYTGWNGNIGWTTIDVFPYLAGNNWSTIFYYNDDTNTTMVNYSDNKEIPIEWEKGNPFNRTSSQLKLYDPMVVKGAYFFSSWGMDSSGNGNNFIETVNITLNPTGVIGGSINLSNLGANLSTATDVFDPTTELEISFWVLFQSQNIGWGDNVCPVLVDSNADGITNKIGMNMLWAYQPDRMRNRIRRGDTVLDLDTGSTLPLNTWIYYVYQFKDNTLNIYVNGVIDNSSTVPNSGPVDDSGLPWRFGNLESSGRQCNMSLDQLTIKYEASSAAKIKAEYETQKYNYTLLGAEYPVVGYANEVLGDDAIYQGVLNSTIKNSLSFNNSDQQLYAAYNDADQEQGKFDWVVSSGNQTWAFNYVTAGDPTSPLNNVTNMTPVLYVWQSADLTYTQIGEQVTAFIEATKQEE